MLVAKPGASAEQNDSTDVGPQASVGNVLSKQELAGNIKLGIRFPSFQVLNQSDARPWQFAQWLKSDGRSSVILIAGNLANKEQWQRVQRFGEALADPHHSCTDSPRQEGALI